MPGLTNHALAVLLETGVSNWVALFTTAPNDDGTGGVEATGSGYVRCEITDWINTVDGNVRYRESDGQAQFDPLTGDLEDIVAWGIYDASVAGNLIAWGPLLDVAGNEITKTFTSGNNPNIPAGELKVGVRDE